MRRLFPCSALAALCCLGAPSPLLARAPVKAASKHSKQDVMDPKTLAALLPSAKLFDSEEMRKEFDRAHTTPLGDARLSFEVLTPKGWVSRPVTVTRKQVDEDRERPVPLLEMGPEKDKKVILEVRYMRVPEAITLEKFFLTYIDKSGLDVLGRQHREFNGHQVEEALLRTPEKGFGTFYTRLTVSRHGELIFMLAGSALEKEYPQYAKIFGAAAASFEAGGPDKK